MENLCEADKSAEAIFGLVWCGTLMSERASSSSSKTLVEITPGYAKSETRAEGDGKVVGRVDQITNNVSWHGYSRL